MWDDIFIFFLAISLVHSLLARKVKKMENEARSTFRMRSVLLKRTDVARSIFQSPENGIINAIRLVGRYETILPWFFDFNEPILEEFQSSAFSTWPWKNPYSFSFLLPPRYDFWLGSRVICCRRIWKILKGPRARIRITDSEQYFVRNDLVLAYKTRINLHASHVALVRSTTISTMNVLIKPFFITFSWNVWNDVVTRLWSCPLMTWPRKSWSLRKHQLITHRRSRTYSIF